MSVPNGSSSGGNGKNGGGLNHASPAVQAVPEHYVSLPCDLCLRKVSPQKVGGWLADLDETAQSGNLETQRLKIGPLQEQLRPGVQKQEQPNHILKED